MQFSDILNPAVLINAFGELLQTNPAFNRVAERPALTDALVQRIDEITAGTLSGWTVSCKQSRWRVSVTPIRDTQWLCTFAPSEGVAISATYSTLIDAINLLQDGIVLFNAHGTVELVNHKTLQVLGVDTATEIQGSNVNSLIDRLMRQQPGLSSRRTNAMARLVRRRIDKSEPLRFEIQSAQGRVYHYRDQVGRDGVRIGLLVDESHYSALIEQLEQACEQANQLSQTKSQFLASMSHEVKTPLNAIIGMLDLCLMDQELKHNEYLQRIQINANHLLQLLNDVLDTAKLEAEKVSLVNEVVDVRGLMEQLVEGFVAQATLKSVRLCLYVDPLLDTRISLDPVRFRQVLYNLLSNAIKFSHSGGSVIISVKRLSGNYIECSVEDQGIGISPDQQKKIFTGFEQASSDTYRHFGGTGLGLHISQRLCQLMGAELSVSSELGQGARFSFALQLTERHDTSTINSADLRVWKLITNSTWMLEQLTPYAKRCGFGLEEINQLPEQKVSNQLVLWQPAGSEPEPIEILRLADLDGVLIYTTTPFDAGQLCQQMRICPLSWTTLVNFIGINETNFSANEKATSVRNSDSKLQSDIVVVEDNAENRFVLSRQLASLGISARLVESAEQGLEEIARQPPELLITDYQLPGMSGADLVKQLKQSGEPFMAVRTCVLTADKTKSCIDDCYGAGADLVVMKPITVQQLQQHLRNLCQPVDDFFYLEEPVRHAVEGELYSVEELQQFTGPLSRSEINDYLSEYAKRLTEQKTWAADSVTNKQWANLGKAAHSIKNGARLIAAMALVKSSEALEHYCRDGESEQDVVLQWLSVKADLEQLQNALTLQKE